MQEIERKFLILDSPNFREDAFSRTRIVQGYLNSAPERTVRVRIRGDKGFLTIKGKSSSDGLSRYEWEREIPLFEAEELLKLSEPRKIEKYRYEIKVENHTFEVDEFLGENEGLLMAEVELNNETEEIKKPLWLGKEVTGDQRYYNSYLSKFPFKEWQTDRL
ncbi:CYTH domain-containing protein [Salinimicrobium sp. TH3]|uniref:CYTH domain-containing protein n=1 Tax=Salinimicrobium sp. TH3 TaxID=2997342 RepID=UPI00227334D3|nr:CYTH domain-containing protein [Salinimicrobium sp. TH3]MCY2686413.1 CYTH domain-containing protein [Salinimicrobium sp. TH3]